LFTYLAYPLVVVLKNVIGSAATALSDRAFT